MVQNAFDLTRAKIPVPCQIYLGSPRFQPPSQKPVRAVRAAGYNGRPFSGSGTASEELLENMLRDLAESVFPGSTTQSQQDLRLAVDEHETLIGYVYYADIPGVQQDNLQVNLASPSRHHSRAPLQLLNKLKLEAYAVRR